MNDKDLPEIDISKLIQGIESFIQQHFSQALSSAADGWRFAIDFEH